MQILIVYKIKCFKYGNNQWLSITYSTVSTLHKYQHPLLTQLWSLFTMELIVFWETKCCFRKKKYFIVASIVSRHQNNACVFALFLTFFAFFFIPLHIFHFYFHIIVMQLVSHTRVAIIFKNKMRSLKISF